MRKFRASGILALGVFLATVAINSASAKLANSPWPKFGHDLRNTGRSPYEDPEDNTLK